MSARSCSRSGRLVSLAVCLLCARPALAQVLGDPPSSTEQLSLLAAVSGGIVGTGAFTTSIPIELPAGHGHTPSLSLSFNSLAGNGMLGTGFRLQGIPVIERKGAHFGGAHFGVTMFAPDIFVVDGQELVPCAAGSVSPSCTTACPQAVVNGACPVAVATNYSAKVEDYQRYRHEGTTWTVWSRNGTVATFSAIDATTVGTTSWTTRWGISTITDTNGNVATVTWTAAAGGETAYPQTLSYNGTSGTVVTFGYDATRPDIETWGNGNALRQMSQRLSSITVKVGGSLLRSYNLTYTKSSATGRSNLSTVKEVGRDGTTAMPTTTLGWTGNDDGTYDPSTNGQIVSGGYRTTTTAGYSLIAFADIDGDGRKDFIEGDNYSNTIVGANNIIVHLAKGDGTFAAAGSKGASWVKFSPEGDTNQNTQFLGFADVNGDGKDDAVSFSAWGGAVGVQLSVGDGYFKPITWSYVGWAVALGVTARPFSFADVNGDGCADFVQSLPKMDATDQAFVSTHLSDCKGSFGNVYTSSTWANFGGVGDYTLLTMTDVDGDGKFDLLLSDGNNNIYYYPSAKLVLNDISTNWTSSTGVQVPVGSLVKTGDVNGDGLVDIVALGTPGKTGIVVYLALGGGRFAAGQVTDTTGTTWAGASAVDVTGDGKADVVAHHQGHTYVYESLGTGLFKPMATYAMTSPSSCEFASYADITGDGKVEIIKHCEPSAGGIASFNSYVRNGGLPDNLTSLDNGIGGMTHISYTPSSASSPCIPGDGHLVAELPPACSGNNPPISQIMSSMVVTDGRGGSAQTTYSYAGGRFDRYGRHLLGFGYGKRTLPALANETASPSEETWFLQNYGTSKINHTLYRDPAGRALTASYYMYTQNNSVPYTALLTETQDWICATGQLCIYDQTKARKHSVTRSYDSYGNVRVTNYNGLLDISGDETQTVTTYVPPNTTAYIVDRVGVVQLFDCTTATNGMCVPTTTKLSETQFWYDTAAPPSPAGPYSPASGTLTKGLVTTELRWLDTQSRYVRSTFTYDGYGNQISVTDELNHTTSKTYDGDGLFPITGTNALNQKTNTTWDPICGTPLSVTDANSQKIVFTYDALCRLTGKVDPGNGFEKHYYCGSGGTCAGAALPACGTVNVQHSCVETPSADGKTNQWAVSYFDGLGRTIASAQKGTSTIRVDTTYDARGNVSSTTLPRYDQSDGSGSGSSGDPVNTVFTSYDSQNRPVLTTLPDGNTVAKSYTIYGQKLPVANTSDPAVLTVQTTDESGHKFETDTALSGRIRATRKRPDGTNFIETRNEYDKRGDLVRTTGEVAASLAWGSEPIAETETYKFDSLGRRTHESSPDHGTRNFVYDDTSHLVFQTDALTPPQTTAVTYDALGRGATRTLRSGTAQAVMYTYKYDEAATGCYNIGRPTSTLDPSGQRRQCYDKVGRLAYEARIIDGVAYLQSYTYDLGGRLLSKRYPDGDTIGPLVYDAAGRVTAIPGIVNSAVYDASGRLLTQKNANGTTTNRVYSSRRGWLTSLSTDGPSGAGTIQNLSYSTWQADGFLNQVTGLNANETWSYGYDAAHRLTCALAGGTSCTASTQTFKYADNGNITTGPLGSYTFGGAQPHAVTTAGAQTYEYDANGNMKVRQDQNLTYDGADRLLSANGVTMIYGADTRLKKVNASTTTTTIYPMSSVEVKVTAGCNSSLTKYISLGGMTVAKRTGATTSWLHVDHLGSVEAVTDFSGSPLTAHVIERRAYKPYGDDSQTVGSRTESHGFTGQHRDETGLVEMGARYYDPQLGRFISPDPTISDGINRYMYALNNPVGKVDPSGFGAMDVVHKVAGALDNFLGGVITRTFFGKAAPIIDTYFGQSSLTGYENAFAIGMIGFSNPYGAQGTPMTLDVSSRVGLNTDGILPHLAALSGGGTADILPAFGGYGQQGIGRVAPSDLTLVGELSNGNPNMLSAHGGLRPLADGSAPITTLKTPVTLVVEHGARLDNNIGKNLDCGNWDPRDIDYTGGTKGARTALIGSNQPDYTFTPIGNGVGPAADPPMVVLWGSINLSTLDQWRADSGFDGPLQINSCLEDFTDSP